MSANEYLCVWVTAERRAQLSRSRSRQNVLSPEEGQTALVREINFDAELDTTPVLHRHDVRQKTHTQKVNASSACHNSRQANGKISRSEAEQLLERLRAL